VVDVQATVVPVNDEVAELRARLAAAEAKLAAPVVAVTAPAPVVQAAPVESAAEADPEPEQPAAVEPPAPALAPLPPHLRPPAAVACTGAVAVRGNALPAVPQNRNAFFDDQNIEFSDIQVPSLNLVQKVGELSESFDPGEVILDRQLPLPRPVRLAVLGISAKRYVERVEGEDGQGGNIAYSLDEVARLGGSTLYSEHEQKNIPWYQTLVTALLLVEKHEWVTEEGSGLFQFEDTGTGLWYALARWNLKGTLYNQGAKVFMTARAMGQCKNGYPTAWWTLDTTSFKTRNQRTVIAPKVRFAGASTPEFQAFARQCIGSA
jgi:hypothetical protein